MDEFDHPQILAVMQHRLAAVEDGLKELRTAIEKAVGVLGGQMTALQTTLVAAQQDMPKSYTPRPEADERQRRVGDALEDLDRRITENRERIARLENLGWGFIVGLTFLALGVVFAIFRTGIPGVP